MGRELWTSDLHDPADEHSKKPALLVSLYRYEKYIKNVFFLYFDFFLSWYISYHITFIKRDKKKKEILVPRARQQSMRIFKDTKDTPVCFPSSSATEDQSSNHDLIQVLNTHP